jgi:integrase
MDHEKRRSTAGPTIEDVRRMLAATSGETEQQTRDYAMVLTFVCLGLRVSELCALNIEDVDLDDGAAWIKGKGRREKELVPLPAPVVAAMRRYLPYRRGTPNGSLYNATAYGPLFQTWSARTSKQRTGRLETRSVLRIVRTLGQKVGVKVWCHFLRHTPSTTAILEGQKAGIALNRIQTFSRHKLLTTMLGYYDEHDRTGVQRTIADAIALTLTGERGAS